MPNRSNRSNTGQIGRIRLVKKVGQIPSLKGEEGIFDHLYFLTIELFDQFQNSGGAL
jgi:hypothetical protein